LLALKDKVYWNFEKQWGSFHWAKIHRQMKVLLTSQIFIEVVLRSITNIVHNAIIMLMYFE
ncbi:MAG TPA: hypothetical protein VFP47_05880, partial [Pyrinomonadaceae bacterium]|nr:hypothetical protein [Pyrinomonadaceae bacterium]